MESKPKYEISDEDRNLYELFLSIKKEIPNNQNDFEFLKGKVTIAGQNFAYEENEKEYYFLYNSKYLNFVNQKNEIKRTFFIHDEDSFRNALKETKIVNGVLKNIESKNEKKNYNSNNSQSSSSSIEPLDIENILNNSIDTIVEEDYIKSNKIFNENNFNKRFAHKYISDLDFNLNKYYTNISYQDTVNYIHTQNQWYSELNNFYKKSIKPTLFILGSKGIGKTTLLLKFLNIEKIPRLYFSIKKMYNMTNKKWKKISFFESIYAFSDKEEMEEFSKICQNENFNYINLMEFLYSYIIFFFKFFIRKKRKKIVLVFDDYSDVFDREEIISKIIDYSNDNGRFLTLWILGEGQFINKKLYQSYINYNESFSVFYWDISIDDEISKLDNILKIPLYYYGYKNKIKDIKVGEYENKKILNDFIEEEKENLKKKFEQIKLDYFFLLSKYSSLYINVKELKGIFEFLPIEYIEIKTKKDENDEFIIKIEFKLEIYNTIFINSIKGLLKIEHLKNSKLIIGENNKGKYGIELEEILVEQLWNNIFDYINFPETNKIKIKEIYHLKDNEVKINNLDISQSIIIRQTLSKGKYYDLLIIVIDNGKKYAIFIQIGLNKKEFEILLYYNNLSKYYIGYKNGIENLINDKIDSLGFLLILDYEKQMDLKNKNNKTDGVACCKRYNIEYLIYKDFQLYNSLDSVTPINSFQITNNLLLEKKEKENNIIDLIKYNFIETCEKISLKEENVPDILLEDNEKKAIINYINDKYKIEIINLSFILNIHEKIDGIKNFGIIDKNNFDQLNLYEDIEKKAKYICFNNEVAKINKDKIEKIHKNQLININKKKFKWELYFLNKKRKPSDKIS